MIDTLTLRHRVIGGLVIIAFSTAAFIFVSFIFYTDAEDEATAIDELYEEMTLKKELATQRYTPKITKWDFEITLPVAGSAGTYQWRVQGDFSTPYEKGGQKILGFVGETMDSKTPVRLVSREMVFEDRKSRLWTEAPIYGELGWGTVSGVGMEISLAKEVVSIKDAVEVVMETSELPEDIMLPDMRDNEKTSDASGNEGSGGPDGDPDEDKLVITSEKLKIIGQKDQAVFTGEVVAKDKQGTITADEMLVQNYTKEEKKTDPTKTGIKNVTCKGRVLIDLTDQAAKCHHALFDTETNIVTLNGTNIDGKFVQVEYWNKEEQTQILADKMIINRATKEVEFIGHQKSTDFNPDKDSFLSFGLEDEKKSDGETGDGGEE